MSFEACAALVERGDPDRFLAVMAAPPDARQTLFPLYAFALEVARAPWVTEEPMIAEMRLQWWRDALDEIAAGGTVRRHEVVTPLAALLDAEAARCLDQAVAARRWDIYKDPFEDASHFEDYLDATSGHVLWTAARLLGAAPSCEKAVRDIAWAIGVQRWLQAIPALEDQNRKPLVDGRPEAVQALAREALGRWCSGRKGLDRAGRIVALLGFETEPLLKQIGSLPARVGEGALGISEIRRRLRLLRLSAFL